MSQIKKPLQEVAQTVDALKTSRVDPIPQEQQRAGNMDFIRSLVLDIPVQSVKETQVKENMNLERAIEAQLEAAAKQGETPDPADVITMDVPLLIRLLEYSREDAKTDIDLHNVTENLIKYSKLHDVLSMDQYDQIVAAGRGGNEDPNAAAFAGEPQSESIDFLKKLAGIK